MAEYSIHKLFPDTWSINEGGVRCFLLAGSEWALLIDSGMMLRNARDIAAQLTDRPIRLLNTHADRDHIGSNAQFPEVYMNPAEAVNYYKCNGGQGTIVPVEDKDLLDLGGRQVRIVSLPGHTPGSIGVLDIASGALFSGDPVQDGDIFMFGAQREMHAYIRSIEKLEAMASEINAFYPSHGTCPMGKEILPRLRQGAEKILAGTLTGIPIEMFGTRIQRIDIGGAVFLCDR